LDGLILNDETILAGAVFALVKLVGYLFVAGRIARHYRPGVVAAPALVVALSRIALAALVGGIVAGAFDVDNTWSWYGLLVLLRFVEWAAIVWLFYERLASEFSWDRLLTYAGLGTAVSCALDLPGVFGAIAVPILAYGFC
jgi:hypothetical protein